jgi:hypothetical protein
MHARDYDLPSGVLFGTIAAIAILGAAAMAFAQCGDPTAGTCCAPHSGLGCADANCCKTVCNVDPFCCDVGWDEYCAGGASVLCADCEPTTVVVMGFGASIELSAGVVAGGCDLAAFDPDTGVWSTYFDGDDVGLGGMTIAAASRLPDGDLVIAVSGGGVLPGLVDAPVGNAFTPQDLLRFTPTELGGETSGTWTFFFDGSDVGLASTASYEFTGVSVLEDGSVVASLKGTGSLPGGVVFGPRDLVRFEPGHYGSATAGTWTKYFEGGDVGLTTNGEKLDAVVVDLDGAIFFSTNGNFGVFGASGTRRDLFGFSPSSLGTSTSGVFSMYLTGAAMGLPNSSNPRAVFFSRVTYPTGTRPDGGGGGGGGPACGDPLAGSCCVEHETPYCADDSCCDAVCAVDPVCCSSSWDAYCVNAAARLCEPCEPTPLAVMAFGAARILPGGVAVDACDLAAFDTGTGLWSIYLDGDDVGLTGATISAATVLSDGDLLVGLEAPGELPGLIGGPDEEFYTEFDVLRFTPISLGADSSGSWSFHFDGSDVGLAGDSNRGIRSIAALPNGSLVMSTLGSSSISGVGSFKAHDLLRFTPSSLGDVTAGSWSMHFDGSDVGLSHNSQEPLDAAQVLADGRIMISTRGNISVPGYSGGRSDLVEFTPTSIGTSTSGSFAAYLTGGSLGLSNDANMRAAFVYTPIVPTTPRPSQSATIMFDLLPDVSINDAAVGEGFERYILIPQGVDPEAASTGLIDADRVVQAIRDREGDAPTGFGMLDFEVPFISRLRAGPSDPAWQGTVDTIVDVLQRLRVEFPQVQWTMYGMPSLPYWSPNGSWAVMSEEHRQQLLEEAVEGFGPVLRECDWISPSSYDRYELATYPESQHEGVTAREVAWRHYQVVACEMFNATSGLPAKPIIAMVSPMFRQGGQVEYLQKVIPLAEFFSDQIHPLMAAGADGVAIWTALEYFTRAATSSADLGEPQAVARYAYVQDFLGGVEPLDWTDPVFKAELQQMTSAFVLLRLNELKAELENFVPEGGSP